MSLEFAGFLFAGDNRTGQSLLVGVGRGNRYSPIRADQLKNSGLYGTIGSAEIVTSALADGNMVFLKNDDFTGPFAQITDARSGGDLWWHITGHIGSVLLIAGNKQGTNETRVSFRDQFLNQWNSFLDNKLQGGRASREGDPTLTWEVFPASDPYNVLNPNLTYLKIYQPLHIHMPWYWPDYAASMTYHLFLYATGDGHLRAAGIRWAYWVESGAKSGRIASELEPQVRDGLGSLQDQTNQQFQLLDGVLGTVTDVYYLPGRQLQNTGTGGLTGNTVDDVTIVIERR
jgi:hypothetical protein